MGRPLGRLPPEVIVYAIEGKQFGHGEEITAEGMRGLEEAIGQIEQEIRINKFCAH